MHEKDSRAATDIGEFIYDLEAGQAAQQLSVALSQVAAAVVDREKKGRVSIAFEFEHIPGTHQVRIAHTVKYLRPTMTGQATEEASGATVLHVSRGGALSLAQPELPGMPTLKQDRIQGA